MPVLPLVGSGPIQPLLLYSAGNEVKKLRSILSSKGQLDEVTMPNNGQRKRLRVVDGASLNVNSFEIRWTFLHEKDDDCW